MTTNASKPSSAGPQRWRQLLLGVLCMVLIANLQYSWTLFVQPMSRARTWAVADIQWAFSIFIALETWLTPLAGWIVDRLGPRRGPRAMVFAGGVMVAAGWVLDAYATALWTLYLAAAVSGLGAGGIYATCVGGAVKWFPDRRGLAVGLTAGGFGAGAALTVIPIKMMIASQGYAATFFWFGLLQGAILCLVSALLRAPEQGEVAAAVSGKVRQSLLDTPPGRMLASPVFWLLYVMFVMISASGLMATAQLALIATDYRISDQVIFLGASTLSVALVVDNVANGAARPFFGWVSDRIGRETTMALAFGCGALAYLLLAFMGTSPWLFVALAALIFFTWGEIFSLFPSTCTDIFGARFATVNSGLLYTAKGASALLVPLANLVRAATGGWASVFVAAAVMNGVVVLLALFVLPPMRARQQGGVRAAMAPFRPSETG
jgi:OFA family oxalate/formate antiporter-like MFS transporter